MFRFGITDLTGLASAESTPGREVSAPLLWSALHADPERWGGPCRAAFNRMRMGNGVYKYTAPHRFDDIMPALMDVLRRELGAQDPLHVHDLGVSDGTTSFELHAELARHWKRIRFVMSDFFDSLYVVRFEDSPWTCILDATLAPIQYVSRRFVLTPQRRPGWRLPFNRLLLRSVERALGPRATDAAKRSDLAVEPPKSPPGVRIERVRMVTKACADLLARDSNVTFIRHDVLTPIAGKFHLVRAMNVLNRSYFDAAQLALAISHAREALHDGGVLVVGRCIDEQDGRSATTVYRKSGGKLEFITRFHEGSELESLIGAMR